MATTWPNPGATSVRPSIAHLVRGNKPLLTVTRHRGKPGGLVAASHGGVYHRVRKYDDKYNRVGRKRRIGGAVLAGNGALLVPGAVSTLAVPGVHPAFRAGAIGSAAAQIGGGAALIHSGSKARREAIARGRVKKADVDEHNVAVAKALDRRQKRNAATGAGAGAIGAAGYRRKPQT